MVARELGKSDEEKLDKDEKSEDGGYKIRQSSCFRRQIRQSFMSSSMKMWGRWESIFQ